MGFFDKAYFGLKFVTKGGEYCYYQKCSSRTAGKHILVFSDRLHVYNNEGLRYNHAKGTFEYDKHVIAHAIGEKRKTPQQIWEEM